MSIGMKNLQREERRTVRTQSELLFWMAAFVSMLYSNSGLHGAEFPISILFPTADSSVDRLFQWFLHYHCREMWVVINSLVPYIVMLDALLSCNMHMYNHYPITLFPPPPSP